MWCTGAINSGVGHRVHVLSTVVWAMTINSSWKEEEEWDL